jgi:hypothetical protein
MPEACLSLTEPAEFPLELEPGLASLKAGLIAQHRAHGGSR